MAIAEFLARLIAWVRQGYPEGVPQRDYLPLFALLARRLTQEEMVVVVAGLISEGRLPASSEEADERVRAAIEATTKSPPSEQDIARVLHHLNDAGWDLDGTEAPE